ncbi:MAG: hypothetical protein H6590_01295 [Flavobacteriales bacterium]|nr:hypothetical protein [Flavobacteriales bacterium]MCB9165198.1 hypothetical protein [Flavobacteriales bacterium]MCB9178047.1 hypothetical protein [Flavobacteriales bacterium]HPF90099.1 hypothetical protein [Flavobacteriales bacterium]
MLDLLPYLIAAVAAWAGLQVWQVRRLTMRYEQLRCRNIEQDSPEGLISNDR